MPFKDENDKKAYQKAYRDKNKEKARAEQGKWRSVPENSLKMKSAYSRWMKELNEKYSTNNGKKWTLEEISLLTERGANGKFALNNKMACYVFGRSYYSIANIRHQIRKNDGALP